MNQQTTDVLSTLHEECYFQKRPQPLIELLYDLGVFGRVAEVFWTYHQFGVQSGKWVCQISSSYLAEKLRTDVRTIQRANDKLACLGLIKRTRVKRRFSSSEGEAPAITEITIPDGLVETLLSDSPRRSRPTPSNPNQEPVQPHETTSDPVNSAPCPTSDEIQSPAQPASFTTVNKHSRLGDANTPVQSAAKASARDVHEAKRRLPEILRRAYEMSIMRGDSNVFLTALTDFPDVPKADVQLLVAPLENICQARDAAVAKSKVSVGETGTRQLATPEQAKSQKVHRPANKRSVPHKALSYIRKRLSEYQEKQVCSASESTLAEILYSLSIGTMRGTDLMLAINATLKLIRNRQWARPKGMPEGWEWSNVVV